MFAFLWAVGMFDDLMVVGGAVNKNEKQVLESLPKYVNLAEFEHRLRQKNKLTFDQIFNQPLGNQLHVFFSWSLILLLWGNFILRRYISKHHDFSDRAIFLSDIGDDILVFFIAVNFYLIHDLIS